MYSTCFLQAKVNVQPKFVDKSQLFTNLNKKFDIMNQKNVESGVINS